MRLVRWSAAIALVALLVACGSDSTPSSSESGADVIDGQEIAAAQGCAGCHTTNGDRAQGPTWKGLAGSEVQLDDGRTVRADREYLTRSIEDPSADVVEGFIPIMPDFDLDQEEVAALVSYIQGLP